MSRRLAIRVLEIVASLSELISIVRFWPVALIGPLKLTLVTPLLGVRITLGPTISIEEVRVTMPFALGVPIVSDAPVGPLPERLSLLPNCRSPDKLDSMTREVFAKTLPVAPMEPLGDMVTVPPLLVSDPKICPLMFRCPAPVLFMNGRNSEIFEPIIRFEPLFVFSSKEAPGVALDIFAVIC